MGIPFNPGDKVHFDSTIHLSKSQISEIADQLRKYGGTSFIIVKAGKNISNDTPQKLGATGGIKEISIHKLINSVKAQRRFLEASQDGLIGFQNSNGRRALTNKGAKMLSNLRSGQSTRSADSTKKNQIKANGAKETLNISDSSRSKYEKISATSNYDPREIDEASVEIDEAPVNKELDEDEAVSNIDIISEEDYAKFLAQINKIATFKSDTEKESGPTEKITSSALSNEKLIQSKTAARLAAPKHIEKIKHSDRGEVDQLDLKANKENARLAAASKKDELAAEKKRQFIKKDLAKTELRSEELDQALIVDDEINKSTLNEMLANNEINEDAKKRLSGAANIDERLLTDMLKEQLIDIQAYNKIIKSP